MKRLEDKKTYKYLDAIAHQARVVPVSHDDGIVIFSDLHMGDGGSTDDFKSNAHLFETAVRDYYLPAGFSLVLNGDVEELQRFKISKIQHQWSTTFEIFDQFAKDQRLFKTIGNHDLPLCNVDKSYPYPLDQALKLKFKDDELLVYHGHQASKRFRKENELVGFTLKYIANPLRIKNYSVAHDSRKKFKIEKIAYHYSSYRKIASVIGHTHRPLFESLSKQQRLKHKIEQLCRDYVDANLGKENVKESILSYKRELKKMFNNGVERPELLSSIYHSIFHVPCLFNSGCVIGKRGITCLEVRQGEISLVHWFDKNISKKYLKHSGYEPVPLQGTDYYRMVINQESLDYIFARINLLA